MLKSLPLSFFPHHLSLSVPESVSRTGRGFMLNIHVKFVFLIWGLFGGLLVYFFQANLLTVLLRPQYEKPINSVKDIIDSGMIPFVWETAYYLKDHLLRSPNPLHQQLGDIMVVPKDDEEQSRMFVDDIQGGNTHVYLGIMYDWEYEYGGYNQGDYHTSKDILEGISPYVGKILNKKWEYGDAYNHHLQLYHQVSIFWAESLCEKN